MTVSLSHSHITEHPSILSSFWFWTNFTALLVLDGPGRIYDCIITVMDPITDPAILCLVSTGQGNTGHLSSARISFYGMYPSLAKHISRVMMMVTWPGSRILHKDIGT